MGSKKQYKSRKAANMIYIKLKKSRKLTQMFCLADAYHNELKDFTVYFKVTEVISQNRKVLKRHYIITN